MAVAERMLPQFAPEEEEKPSFITPSLVPVSMLRVKPEYQRELRWSRVKRIAEQWDARLFGAVTVARYPNGRLGRGPADGRHRVEAVVLKWPEEDVRVPCWIVDVQTESEEARLFERLNLERSGVNKSDLFRSRLSRGEPQAEAILKVVQRAGWDIQPGRPGRTPWNVIQNPFTAEFIYQESPMNLIETLEFINAVWAEQFQAKSSQTLLGVNQLIQYYHTQGGWNEKQIRATLSRFALKTVLRNIRGYMHGSMGKRAESIGDELARLYNENRPKKCAALNIPIR